MSTYKSLDRVWEDIKRCYRCGYCRDMVRDLTGTFRPCPVREKLRHEHFSARGRNTIARGLVEGRLTFSYALRDTVYSCLACDGCHDACSLIDWAKVDSPAITRAMREELHSLGMTPKKILSVNRVKAAQIESDGKATCRTSCPIDQDVPSYVGLIAQGRYSEALEVIRQTNPLSSVCGKVCPHPCEFSCRQAEIGAPVSIRRLKRFCVEQERLKVEQSPPSRGERQKGPKVAIVGSGPAGLTAANHLARKGFAVTLFEKNELPGGMMTYGIPDFTLQRGDVLYDVSLIEAQGVKIQTGVRVGTDKTLNDLMGEGFRAVLLCLGTWSSMKMGIPGEDLDGVWTGLEFLKRVKSGEVIPVPRRVAVIGGGKVAIDVGRTAVRLGARDVTILYRRTREEMPVDEESVARALEEGVHIQESVVPIAISGTDGRARSIKTREVCRFEAGEAGDQVPVYLEGSGMEFGAEMVVLAIGQEPDLSGLDVAGGIRLGKEGTVLVDDQCRVGDLPVFGAGDMVAGPTSVVEAMASGRDAARALEDYLNGPGNQGDTARPEGNGVRGREFDWAMVRRHDCRAKMPMRGLRNRKSSFQEVEKGFPPAAAIREASRCLACDLGRFSEVAAIDGADTLFFSGCNNRFRYPETARAAMEILIMGGVRLTLAPDELCCGSPAFWSGNRDLAEKLKVENTALFCRMGVKRVITACSDCYHILTTQYDLERHGIAVEHFVRTLADLLRAGTMAFDGYRGTVTYHDPCQLARKGGVVEEPREILGRVEGLKLVEMKRIKNGTWCCGGGPNQLMRLSRPQLADEIAYDRISEARETGAQVLLTSCPWCRTQFESLKAPGLRIYDLPDFVYHAAGLKPAEDAGCSGSGPPSGANRSYR